MFGLGWPELINFYQLTPSYNLSNLYSWFLFGEAERHITDGAAPLTAEPSAWASLLVLSFWIPALVGLSLWMFQRQEITE